MSQARIAAGSDLGLRGGVRDLDDPCGRLFLPARNPANVLRALRDVRRPLVLSSQPAHLRVALDRVPHRCAGRGRDGVARVEGVESRGPPRDGPTPGRGGVLDRLRLADLMGARSRPGSSPCSRVAVAALISIPGHSQIAGPVATGNTGPDAGAWDPLHAERPSTHRLSDRRRRAHRHSVRRG